MSRDLTVEELGNAIRESLGTDAEQIESVEILSDTSYDDLPPSAITRMGMQRRHKNLLIRLVIRHPVKTLTNDEANELRDLVYGVLHRGETSEWAGRKWGSSG